MSAMASNSPNKDPKADRKRKKEKGRRLWAKIDSAMKKLNDELGYPAGAVMVKDGRIQSCGTLGAAATAAQRLSLAQSVRSEAFEKSRDLSTTDTAQDSRGCVAQGPKHAVYLTPLPRPIENLTETELRSWVPKYVKESTGRNQPRWGDDNFRPPWWPAGVLPFENVNRDHRVVKGSPYAGALRQAVRSCLEYHNIPVEQAVQTTYMESGKAHRKLTECASNVCKGTAPLALVASREATSPEDSENLTRAASLLSEQVTFLLQIAQGLSAADVLTSLSRPVTNSATSEEDVTMVTLSAAAGTVVIDEGPFPLVGTSIVGNGLEEVMVDGGAGFVASLEAASRPAASVGALPHSLPSSMAAAVVAAAASAAAATAPDAASTTVTFVAPDQLQLAQEQEQLHFEQQLQQQQQQLHVSVQPGQPHLSHSQLPTETEQSGTDQQQQQQQAVELVHMLPVTMLSGPPSIQHVEQSIVVPQQVQQQQQEEPMVATSAAGT